MVICENEIISPDMDEDMVKNMISLGGPTMNKFIHVEPDTCTFTVNEKASGLDNEMHVVSIMLFIHWNASMLSDSDSMIFSGFRERNEHDLYNPKH